MPDDHGHPAIDPEAEDPRPPADPTSLGDVLVSLQKSFSWVSSATASASKAHPAEPRSLITGEVDFELTIAGDVAPATGWIVIRESGPITLKLAGTIQHDVVVVDPPEADGSQDAGGPPTESKPGPTAESAATEADRRASEEAASLKRAAEDAARRAEEDDG